MFILFHNPACEIGYHGKDCDTKCPFPSYGHECQLRCACKEIDCDFANGCRKSLNGNFLREYPYSVILTPWFFLFINKQYYIINAKCNRLAPTVKSVKMLN